MSAPNDRPHATEVTERPIERRDSSSDRPDPSEDAPDLEAVYGRLDRVDDPELDRSVVELGSAVARFYSQLNFLSD